MKTPALALALLTVAAASALAQTVTFKAVDANGDGAVTLEEARAAGLDWNDDTIAGFDLDSNGVLNEEEFNAAVGG
jgi:Ca2+-binding EF-hand superfamily protein